MPERERVPPPPPVGGTIRAILTHPDPGLRAPCTAAALVAPAERERLAADLLATMYDARGRGLAAPQVGRAVRMFVMDPQWKSGVPAPVVMLDPQVLWRSDACAVVREQCLSIPDRPVEVSRPVEVRMRWFDLVGVAHEADLSGDAARIAQHEYDHLDGILIVDAADATDGPNPAAAPDRPGR